jgi:hypothetical protein
MNKAKANQGRMIGIIILAAVLVFSAVNPGTKQYSVAVINAGYSTAFQNPQITFYGLSYKGHNYIANSPSTLVFNPNIVNLEGSAFGLAGNCYLPTIQGEMTPVFIPAQSSTTYINAFGLTLPTNWVSNLDMTYAPGWPNNPNAELQNPPQAVATYGWNVTDPSTNTPYTMYMAQWDMKFYVSFSTSWTDSQDPAGWVGITQGQQYNDYNNLWVWFQVSTPATWYIEGTNGKTIGTAYQAIASINLDGVPLGPNQTGPSVQMQAKDNKGNNVQADPDEATNPESAPSSMYLYYSPFGSSVSTNPTPETYEGYLLNPAYFRNVTYFAVDLATFGNYATATGLLAQNEITRGDVATFDFDVTSFVFGQYTVLEILQNPPDYGRTTPETTTSNFLSGILNWLTNPVNVGVLTTLGFLVLIIIFAPWLLVVLIALLFGGKR